MLSIRAGHLRRSEAASPALRLRLHGRRLRPQDSAEGALHHVLPLLRLHPAGHRFRRPQRPQHSRPNE